MSAHASCNCFKQPHPCVSWSWETGRVGKWWVESILSHGFTFLSSVHSSESTEGGLHWLRVNGVLSTLSTALEVEPAPAHGPWIAIRWPMNTHEIKHAVPQTQSQRWELRNPNHSTGLFTVTLERISCQRFFPSSQKFGAILLLFLLLNFCSRYFHFQYFRRHFLF